MVHNTRGQVSEARSRLLATATRIFYAEGLHSVGIDRIVAEAKVTRATLYRHFPSKEDLVVAYLQSVSEMEREGFDEVLAGDLPAAEALRAIARSIADSIRSAHFRGCAFLNAVAEYADPAHPVHQAVLAHREWFLRTVTDLLAQVGETPPELAGRHFVMLRDGAMASGCLSDPAEVCDTFLQGVDGILRFRLGSAAEKKLPAARATAG
ncbi:TetR/AcrR family transcriptional regulator [Amycolatopsis sp. NPDC051061]|uniref:TetR/AcrR family transcriptional regulator n=1 Tax=Amycolatopsis sp. NPDC051061 TaxID=3155042 RepID=UPI0034332704